MEKYLRDLVSGETPAMMRVRREYEREGLPNIEPEVGSLLEVTARAVNARHVLEVGCCLGYSALWLARAVGPGGTVETIEREADFVERSHRHFSDAGVGDIVRIHHGEALDIMLGLTGPYDLVFIDADKLEYLEYLDQATRLVRPGGVIMADNVLWGGRVVGQAEDDETNAIRRFTKALLSNSSFTSTIVPLGDGVSITVVGSAPKPG